MAYLVAADFIAPERIPFSGVQAQESSAGYKYLKSPGAGACVPFGTLSPTERLEKYATSIEAAVSMAPPGTTAADLSVAAAQTLLAKHRDHDKRDIGAIIYCHDSVDEAPNASIAGRISLELELPNTLAFSVSQFHNCSFFVALEMARMLVDGPEKMGSVLIVASDKWLHPFFRRFGSLVCFGDGAGAALVTRDAFAGFEIQMVETMTDDDAPLAFAAIPDLDEARFADRVGHAIARALDGQRIDHGDVDLVIPQSYSTTVLRRVVEAAAMPNAAIYDEGLQRHGHLSSADTLANFASAWRRTEFAGCRRWLLWGAGLNGEIACSVLRRNCDVAARPQRPL